MKAKKSKKVAPNDDAAVQLLKAVGEWVKSRGGNVAVAGGIQIQQWPGDGEFRFYVAIKCTGRRPTEGSRS